MSSTGIRLNVGQIRKLLEPYNANDDVLIYSSAHKLGHITGIDEEMSMQRGAVVLEYNYDEVITAIETEQERIDKEIAQLQALRGKIDRKSILHEMNKKEQHRKKWVQPKKKTLEEMLLSGLLPTGKAGRPRKFDLSTLPAKIKEHIAPGKISEMSPEELTEFLTELNFELDNNR